MLLIMILLASTSHGMVYSWTDSDGITHYTNKEYEIPPRYRAKTKSLYPEQLDTSQQSVQTPQSSPVVLPAPAKPEEPARSTQPDTAESGVQKKRPDRATKRVSRSRGSTEE